MSPIVTFTAYQGINIKYDKVEWECLSHAEEYEIGSWGVFLERICQQEGNGEWGFWSSPFRIGNGDFNTLGIFFFFFAFSPKLETYL